MCWRFPPSELQQPTVRFHCVPHTGALTSFCLGLASPSLSNSRPLAGGIVCSPSSVRRSPPPAWSGKSDQQQHHRMYFSTQLSSNFMFPQGCLTYSANLTTRRLPLFPLPAGLELGKPLTANNGQTHQLCSHSACSFAEDLDPVPGASTVILENSDGHCLLLSDTKYCAHAGVPHCPDASFPRRFQPSTKSLNVLQQKQIVKPWKIRTLAVIESCFHIFIF